jgi:hypothetical protein
MRINTEIEQIFEAFTVYCLPKFNWTKKYQLGFRRIETGGAARKDGGGKIRRAGAWTAGA